MKKFFSFSLILGMILASSAFANPLEDELRPANSGSNNSAELMNVKSTARVCSFTIYGNTAGTVATFSCDGEAVRHIKSPTQHYINNAPQYASAFISELLAKGFTRSDCNTDLRKDLIYFCIFTRK